MKKYLSLLITSCFITPLVVGKNIKKEKIKKISVKITKQKLETKKTNTQQSKKTIDQLDIKLFLDNLRKTKIDMKAIECENYVSGCELISIVNLLNYYGYNTNLDEFYNNFFEHKDWYIDKNIIYAPDPNYIYPGDPKIASGKNCGFGCFGQAVEKSINNFFDSIRNANHKVIFETGAKKERIKELLDKKTPVIIWSTQAKKEPKDGLYEMQKPGKYGNSWRITEPKKSKRKIYTWLQGEHCSVIYGYDDSSYSVCDPFKKNIKLKKESLDKSREIFDNQIVYLIKNPK